ncbi:uncharacterized protein LOC126552307 [Aphis gossypii]|uniref:uncharacterized protein LOC126552307 n=1 Tax=Aphis gossypii TaxID=80765 RepID=UPI0021597CB0|nr:uncharacterized protein LOC126552307 [Aphis gossypii]
MDEMYLDVAGGYEEDCKITQMQYHSFLPYSTTALSNNDEIRISIQNMDAYTLPCESYLYIEAFLFSEIRYEINGVEIQKLKSPGISSSLKGFCSHTPSELNNLQNAAWDVDMDASENKHFISSTDFDALYVLTTTPNEKLKKVAIELNKIIWKMPIIRVSDKEKIKLLKVLDSRKPVACAFRNWDLCEYPVLPQNTSHSWTVKSSSLLEKPRFALIGLQTDRKNNLFNPSGRFDHCYLKNLKVHLNSEVYPYEDFRADFTNNVTAILYKAYAEFQKSYYEREIVDLLRQNDNVKSSTVDLRIEFETDKAIPAKTAAYCLILHDQIITYNPFNGDVRKL